MNTRRLLSVLSILLFCVSLPANAQTIVSGDLTGVVRDPSGAVIPNAALSLRNNDTGQTANATTTGSGQYRFALLQPGAYTLTINQPGFQPISRTVSVAIGRSTTADLTLALNTAPQTVEVTGEAPTLQTDNGNISTSYTSREIQSLPIPGNDITYVAQTAPGIAMNASGGGGYGNFTAFGLPANSNLYTLNGNDEMDPYLNLNNSGASNLTLGANELSEATVINNGYTGQYGRQVGAQVNYTTRSGSNNFHGNAVYFWNGRMLNANDWFANNSGAPRPFVNDNQWAGSIGGPIVKDKTFFFFDTEGIRLILPTSQAVYVPSPQYQSFVLNNLTASGQGAAISFYQRLFSFYNNANGAQRATPVTAADAPNLGCGSFTGGGAFGTAVPCALRFQSTASNNSRETYLAFRMDQNLGASDRLFGRFKRDVGLQPTYTDPLDPIFNVFSNQPQYEGQLNETHAFGTNAANQFVLSGSYYSAVFSPSNLNATLQAFPTTLLFPLFSNVGGTTYNFPQGRRTTQYQVVDDFSWTKGNHNIRFGGNYRRNDVTDLTFGVLTSGRGRVTSLTSFANNILNSYVQRFPMAPEQPIAIYSLGLYAQDQWKLRQNFTITLALRADRNSNAVCQRNCFSRLVAPFAELGQSVNTPYNQAIQTGLRRAFPQLEAVAWQPRIGFAYSPYATTVIRGGAGLFADLYPGTLVDLFARNSPNVNSFTATSSTVPGLALAPGTPNNAFAVVQSFNTTFLNQFASGGTLASIQSAVPAFVPPNFNSVSRRITNPKFAEWNLEVDQSFGRNNALSLNYVGNHGYDIFVENPGLNAACTAATCPAGFDQLPQTTPDRRFGNIIDLRNRAVSNYQGLTASFQRSFSRGLQVKAGYTWSHTLDEVSNGGILPYSLDERNLQFQFDPFNLARLNYGNADYDIRHYFSASYSWQASDRVGGTLLSQVLGGWILSQTFFTRTGLPYTIVDTSAPISLTNFASGVVPTEIVPGSFNGGESCNNPKRPCVTTAALQNVTPGVGIDTLRGFGNQRRNQFRGPGFFDSDLHLAKTFRVQERISLGLGANAFNVLNHPNFANPIFDVSQGNFGTLQSTVSPPTSPFGSFVGAAASGRVLQLEGRLTF